MSFIPLVTFSVPAIAPTPGGATFGDRRTMDVIYIDETRDWYSVC